jgi:hypothetical protein
MSEQHQEQRARAKYAAFLSRLSACRAWNGFSNPDLHVQPGIPISREEVLNAFLTGNPKFMRFRNHLVTVNLSQRAFYLIEARWKKVVAG